MPAKQPETPRTTSEFFGLLASPLTDLFSPEDRDQATSVIVKELLPLRLRNLAHHPKPKRLTSLVFEELLAELSQVPQPQRLDKLSALLTSAQIEEAGAQAMALALARYCLDDPPAQAKATSFATAQVLQWIDLGLDAVRAEAGARTQRLSVLNQRSPNDPQLEFTAQALHAATTGNFSEATGSLLDFVSRVEGRPEDHPETH